MNVPGRAQLVERIRRSQSALAVRRTPGVSMSRMLGGGPPAPDAGRMRRGDHDLNGGNLRPDPPLTPAAVLVPLLDHGDGLTVLLTERAADLRAHGGQISFPGGRIEPGDASPEAAALREAEEEVGLPAASAEIVGRLDTYETRTGFEVIPVVALVAPGFEPVLDSGEVAAAFEVPLAFVLDQANHERHSRVFGGTRRYFHVLQFGDRYIWGATAGMLVNLFEVLTGEKARWR